jgi:hypothetical protein
MKNKNSNFERGLTPENDAINDLLPEPAPRNIETFEQFSNIVDAIDPNKAEEKDPKFGYTGPKSRLQCLLSGLKMVPNTDRSLFMKQVLLWVWAGDTVTIDKNHQIVIKTTYNGKGFAKRHIYKLIVKKGMLEVLNTISPPKLYKTRAEQVDCMVKVFMNTVMIWIEKNKPEIIPVKMDDGYTHSVPLIGSL